MKYRDYKEKRRHGDPNFPLRYYPAENNLPESTMPLHWHVECEIIQCLSGKLVLFLDGKRYEGEEGDVFFLPSGTLHRAPAQNAVFECAVFAAEMLCSTKSSKINDCLYPIISVNSSPICIKHSEAPRICQKSAELFSLLKKETEDSTLWIIAALFEFFALVYSEIPLPAENVPKVPEYGTENIAVLLEWLENNYAEKVTLSQMAELININEHYLCKYFKSFAGITPMEYLNRMRIERACHELAINRKSVTETAYETGFGDPSYFSKVFKKYKGVSPKEYKKA